MTDNIARRGVLTGLAALCATPALAARKSAKEAAPTSPPYFDRGPLARNQMARSFLIPPADIALPKVTLKAWPGQPASLDAFRGKTIMLSLWAEWCPPCLTELPTFDKFNELFGNDRFEIVSVLSGSRRFETPKQTKAFLEKLGAKTMPPLMESGSRLLRALTTTPEARSGQVPCNLLIDPQGGIRARSFGATTIKRDGGTYSHWATEDGVTFMQALSAGILALPREGPARAT